MVNYLCDTLWLLMDLMNYRGRAEQIRKGRGTDAETLTHRTRNELIDDVTLVNYISPELVEVVNLMLKRLLQLIKPNTLT